MQKKMMAAFAALCTMAALMTGCTDVSDGSQTQVDMNAATTAAETTAPAENAETEPAAETAETDTDLSASEEESTAETTDAPAAQSQETIGDTGMTADQWVAQAQQIYDTACQTYYTYRCTSDCFTYDNSDTTEDGYVRITSCDSIEAAEAEYYSVFAQSGHESDFDGMFQMVDDKLYGRLGDRGADISYVSAKVTALTASTDSTLTFSVTASYEEPDSGDTSEQTDTFTLVMERGAWRVSQFTMPY